MNFSGHGDYRHTLQQQRYVRDITASVRESAQETEAAIRSSTKALLTGIDKAARRSSALERTAMDVQTERLIAAEREASDRQTDRLVEAGARQIEQLIDAERDAIARQTSSLREDYERGTQLIVQTQWDAAAQMSRAVREAARMTVAAIEEMNSTFRWSFGQLLASQGRMNDSLESLVKLAKTPAQTAAYEQFDIARDAFRRQLYAESLEALEKAVNSYKIEWRFHKLMGVLRLGFAGCDIGLVDLEKAEQAFLLAARYAWTDEPKEAAQVMLSAGWSAYLQGKLSESLTHTERAVSLNGALGEALFQVAKVRMALGRPQEAIPTLRSAIEIDCCYVIKASADPDFQLHIAELDTFIEVLRQEKLRDVQRFLKDRLSKVEPFLGKSEQIDRHPFISLWQRVMDGRHIGLLELWQIDSRVEPALKELQDLAQKIEEATRRILLLMTKQMEEIRPLLNKSQEVDNHRFIEMYRLLTQHADNGLDILKFEPTVQPAIENLVALVTKLKKPKMEWRLVRQERDFEDVYESQEIYLEEVVVRPASWFRKAQTRSVERMRMIQKTRTVRRVVDLKQFIGINGFGDVSLLRSFGDRYFILDDLVGDGKTGLTYKTEAGERFLTFPETALDLQTGLTWQRVSPTMEMNWGDAQNYAKCLQLDGTGWRLPTVGELMLLLDGSQASPPYWDKLVFSGGGVSSWFWTGTSQDGSGFASGVHFTNRNAAAFEQSIGAYVRCVR